MYCDACGKQLPAGAAFCPSCGKALLDARARARIDGRVGRHLQIVAVLWLVYAGLRVLAGLVVLFVGTVFLPNLLAVWPFQKLVPGILSGVAVLILATGVAGLAAGWGLLQRESWARILALVLAILALLHFPLGTALGIYTLWALAPAQAGEEYSRMGRPA